MTLQQEEHQHPVFPSLAKTQVRKGVVFIFLFLFTFPVALSSISGDSVDLSVL